MTTRNYSSRSQQTTLTSAVTAGASTIVVQSGTALLGGVTIPAGTTFTIVVDPDTALEEIVDATAVSTNTFTITRAIDGSSAQAHSAGAVVRHMAIGRDYREANVHIESSTGVHGIAGAVVGTTDTQTLTNKTLTSPTITNPSISGAGVDASIVFEGAVADAHETTLTVEEPTQDNTITLPNTTGTVVIANAAQTLTNKTMGDALNAGGFKITNLATPTLASDAVRKDFADAQVAAAATSAASASTSAASAATSASSALTSANSAATSAANALTSANSAATSASTMNASVVAAAASATAAATSATSAAASATAAATSATSAAASATAASTSATSASASATAAATSATSAAASATTAANSVATIAGYATTASNSASAAATSASSALTSQTAAATSATSAAASATAAATSATSAAASATAAATSATSAAASATTAAGYVVPTQTGNAGKALTTDGTTTTWSATINGTAIPATKTLVVTTDKLSALAATTSAELAGVISDETGTGALVFANTPTLVTPALGDATATSIVATVASGTTVPLTIQNNGTGNSFVVNDVASDTSPFIVDQSGNVGIGAATPAVKLHIIPGQTATILETIRLDNPGNAGDNGNKITWYNAATGIEASAISSFREGSSLNFALGFNTTANFNTTAATERMRINGLGLVGIGATPSGAMFTVVNNTIGNIGAIIRGASGQTAGLLEVQNNAATALVKVDSVGNVGIGTTTPATYGMLSVAIDAAGTPKMLSLLNARTYGNADGKGVMIAALASNGTVGTHDYGSIAFGANSDTGADGSAAIVAFFAGGQSSIKTSTQKYLEAKANSSSGLYEVALWTGGSSRLYVNNTGLVGIGTTSPTAKLDVNGSIKSDNLSSVNAVLNSGMNVWQRGTSIGATNQSAYTADRWMVSTAASMSVTVSRQATSDTTNLPNIQYCMRVQRNNGQTATGNWNMQQSMESINSIPFAGKSVTLSFYARKGANFSAASDLMSVGFYSGTGTDQNFQTGYTGTTNIVNTTQALTTTWVRYTFTGSVPSTATEMALVLGYTATGTAGANDYYEITGVQVELGSVATPYQPNQSTYQAELAACQRYYETQDWQISKPYIAITYTTNVVARTLLQWKVTKRTTPSITWTNNGGIRYISNNGVNGSQTLTANLITVDSAGADTSVGFALAGAGWLDQGGTMIISAEL